MRCRPASLSGCLAGLTILTLFSGCYSMNGYMMNSSGQALYNQGNYSMAAAEFQKAVASAPNNPDYTANLARTRYKMGDVSGAEQLYRQNLMASPSHQPSYHGLAELMVAQGRGAEATSMLSSWSATQPYVAESHLEMAWLQKELGQPDAAAQSLQQALQVNPGHPKALAHLGEFYQQNGQHQQAAAMYQQSLQAQWNQPEVHSRLTAATAAAGPTHPVNAAALAQGATPPGYGPRRMAQARPPMMAQSIPPHVSPGAGPMNVAHTTALPPAMGFGSPVSASFPTAVPPQQPVTPATLPVPTPDPGFEQPENSGTPATTVSHETMMIPQQDGSLPAVDAF